MDYSGRFFRLKKIMVALFLLILISACTPAKIPPSASMAIKFSTSSSEDTTKSELLIYREHAVIGMLADVVIGFNGGDAFQLANERHVVFKMMPGDYQVFTRGEYGDRPFSIPVTLLANKRVCLKVFAPNSNAIKMIVPILHYTTSAYHLEKINCPSDDFLFNYPRTY